MIFYEVPPTIDFLKADLSPLPAVTSSFTYPLISFLDILKRPQESRLKFLEYFNKAGLLIFPRWFHMLLANS